jgi:hypothetical protein
MLRLADVVSPVLGETYLVPSINAIAGTPYAKEQGDCSVWVPVNGPIHHDMEIGNYLLHIHCDERFMTDHMVKMICHTNDVSQLLQSTSISIFLNNGEGGHIHGSKLNSAHHEWGRTVIQERPFEYVREFPIRPMPQWTGVTREEFLRLEEEMGSKHLPPSNTCPHKGLALDPAQADAEGNVICPGHYLCWNIKTRKIKRTVA